MTSLMSKAIWIINEYAGSPEYGLNFRHYYLAREFKRHGFHVTIISASFSHLLRKYPVTNGMFTREEIGGIPYIWVKVPHYSESNSPRRILKWLAFSSKLLFLPELPKPQAVIASPTATFPIIPAYFLARKHKAKFVLEIRDIWPLSIVELGKISKSHPLILIMSYLEKFGIKKCNHLVSNLSNYDRYLKQKGFTRHFEYIPNGVELDEVTNGRPLNETCKSLLPKEGFVVGYAGSIGCANALQYLVLAAQDLYNQDIKIVVVGDGQEKEKLRHMAKNLDHVYLLPSIPKEEVQELLKRFDICYIGWNDFKMYDYGIAANKLFEYMFAAKPILSSCNNHTDIVEKTGCGMTVEAENPQSIAQGIMKMYEMPQEKRFKMGLKGKEYVLKHHLYSKLADDYVKLLE